MRNKSDVLYGRYMAYADIAFQIFSGELKLRDKHKVILFLNSLARENARMSEAYAQPSKKKK